MTDAVREKAEAACIKMHGCGTDGQYEEDDPTVLWCGPCAYGVLGYLAGHEAARIEALEDAAKLVCSRCRDEPTREMYGELWHEGGTAPCPAEPIHRELARLRGQA